MKREAITLILLSLAPFCLAADDAVGPESFTKEQRQTYALWQRRAEVYLFSNRQPVTVYLSSESVKKDSPDVKKKLMRVRSRVQQTWLSFNNDDENKFMLLSMEHVFAFKVQRPQQQDVKQVTADMEIQNLDRVEEQSGFNGLIWPSRSMDENKGSPWKSDVYLSMDDVVNQTPTLSGVIFFRPARIADVWCLQFGTDDRFETVWFVPASKVIAITCHPDR